MDDMLHIQKLREWISDEQTWINLWRGNAERLFL